MYATVVGSVIHSPSLPSVLHLSGGDEWIILMVLILVILGIIVYLITHQWSRPYAPFGPPMQPFPPPGQTFYRQNEVVREAAKVACRHCGTLADVTATHCPSCGSPLR
jgi:hypothetical protein